MSKGLGFFVILGVVASICVQVFVYPFVIEWLWNIIIHPVTGAELVTYWQAFGLRMLVIFLTHVAESSK